MAVLPNTYVGNPARQCGSKRRYLSKKSAKYWIRRKRRVRGLDLFSAYRCPHCGFFHVGRRQP